VRTRPCCKNVGRVRNRNQENYSKCSISLEKCCAVLHKEKIWKKAPRRIDLSKNDKIDLTIATQPENTDLSADEFLNENHAFQAMSNDQPNDQEIHPITSTTPEDKSVPVQLEKESTGNLKFNK